MKTKVFGWQEPPIMWLPEVDITGSMGQACVDLAAMAGLKLDPWQQWLVNYCLAYTDEIVEDRNGNLQNKLAARTVGIMVSRQNGKGSVLEALELFWLFMLGDQQVVHSAHDFRTSMKHMERMVKLIHGHKDLKKQVASIRRSNGSEGIILKSGQELNFVTRTKSGARGWSAEKVVMDEAMFATPEQIKALLPTLSAMPNPQLVYTGSAGDRESIQFGSVRKRALSGQKASRLFYAEWSCDLHSRVCTEDCTIHDSIDTPEDSIKAYAKSNPALGFRLSVEDIEAEREEMEEDLDGFAQERLGVGDWPEESEQWTVITKDEWFDRKREISAITSETSVLGVSVSPDLNWSCIVACGQNRKLETHVEITGRVSQYDYRPGISWVVAQVLDIVHRNPDIKAVVIDKRGQAGSFIDELELYGVYVISPTAAEYGQACGDFFRSVVPARGEVASLVHLGQPAMNAAVAGAIKRDVSNMWFWDKRLSEADITPLDAATLARWGYMKIRNEKPRTIPMVARL